MTELNPNCIYSGYGNGEHEGYCDGINHHYDLCEAADVKQRIADLEAERDHLKAQLGQVRDLFIEIDTCEDYIHQFEGAENCGLCIPRTAEIWKLLGITP